MAEDHPNSGDPTGPSDRVPLDQHVAQSTPPEPTAPPPTKPRPPRRQPSHEETQAKAATDRLKLGNKKRKEQTKAREQETQRADRSGQRGSSADLDIPKMVCCHRGVDCRVMAVCHPVSCVLARLWPVPPQQPCYGCFSNDHYHKYHRPARHYYEVRIRAASTAKTSDYQAREVTTAMGRSSID